MRIDSEKIKETIDSIEVDTHWFRRVFHTFASSFLIYYLLPNNIVIKFIFPTVVLIFIFLFEILRLKRKIDRNYFFGLRLYENYRPASYLYFGVAAYVLLLLFPQQIAIPCILCGCFSDPIIGELRRFLGKYEAYIVGFFISMILFIIIWFDSDIFILFSVSVIGGLSAIYGESRSLKLFDDDFVIQIFPAFMILIFIFILKILNIIIVFEKIIIPI